MRVWLPSSTPRSPGPCWPSVSDPPPRERCGSTGRCQQRDTKDDLRFHRPRDVLEVPLRIDVEAEGLLRHDPHHADLKTQWNIRPLIALPIVGKLRVARAQRPPVPELVRDYGLDLTDSD